jgi:hypothetical protein
VRVASLLFVALMACGRSGTVRYSSEPAPIAPVDAGCDAMTIDTYTVEPAVRRPIDVLFVIDDSCSMENDQRLLSQNLESFFETFQSNQVDFHVGVVTTDMESPTRGGRLVAPFLTHQTPNVTELFQRMVRVGIDGSANELGLSAAYEATRPPLSTTTNAGFLRPEADFALVFLSDEDDGGARDPVFLANAIKDLKTDGASITVGTILLGCQNMRSWRYWRFTEEFGDRGLITRCTQQYANTLRTIAGRVVNKQCVVGLRAPVDPSLQLRVTLNGMPAGFRLTDPEPAYPNGSIELDPCPDSGGRLELAWDECGP